MNQPKRRKVTGYAIDSPTSKDLDDAILLTQKQDGRFLVTVSIADVSGAISKGSDVDTRAFDRAFTRYFAQGNNPMIPARLADNELSLLPHQTRNVLVFEVTLDKNLEIEDVSIELGTFRSKRRYTHKQVDDALEQKQSSKHQMWMTYYKFAERLLNKRRAQGAMVIYDLDQGLYSNEEGSVLKKEPGMFFRPYIIVQEFMILANHAVTSFLAKQGVDLLYRNHSPLMDADGSNQQEVLQKLYGAENITPEVLTELNGRMRTLVGRARYESSCKGHFGLSLPAYAHWTSPIRRYADLVNHRQAVAWLMCAAPAYTSSQLEAIGAHLNEVNDAVKDRVRDVYKTKTKKGLQNANFKKLTELSDGHFSYFVRLLTEEEMTLTEQRLMAVENRIKGGTLPLVDYTCILFTEAADTVLWRRLKENALQALANHPNNVRSLLNIAKQKHGWKNDVTSSPLANGLFKTTVSIWRRERTYTSEPCTGQGKAESETQAIFDMLRRMHTIDIELPEKGVKATMSVGNAKGALMEHCQKRRWPMPTFSSKQTGPSHQPLFSCTGRLRPPGKPEMFTEPCQATSRKASEQLASRALLKMMGVNHGKEDASSVSGQPAVKANGTDWKSNPISALQEYCQKKGYILPNYSDSQSGPDHMRTFDVICSVTIEGVDKTFKARGSNKKQGKKAAALKACEKVFTLG